MNDENFKALCEAHNFLRGIIAAPIQAPPYFWEESTAAAEKIQRAINAECPGYFASMQARWDHIKKLKKDGASAVEIENAATFALSRVGVRVTP